MISTVYYACLLRVRSPAVVSGAVQDWYLVLSDVSRIMCGISFYVSAILIPYLCGVWHMPHTTPLLQRMIPEVCEAYAARGKRQEARGKRQEARVLV